MEVTEARQGPGCQRLRPPLSGAAAGAGLDRCAFCTFHTHSGPGTLLPLRPPALPAAKQGRKEEALAVGSGFKRGHGDSVQSRGWVGGERCPAFRCRSLRRCDRFRVMRTESPRRARRETGTQSSGETDRLGILNGADSEPPGSATTGLTHLGRDLRALGPGQARPLPSVQHSFLHCGQTARTEFKFKTSAGPPPLPPLYPKTRASGLTRHPQARFWTSSLSSRPFHSDLPARSRTYRSGWQF